MRPTQPGLARRAGELNAAADGAADVDERALVAAAQRDPAAFDALYRRTCRPSTATCGRGSPATTRPLT